MITAAQWVPRGFAAPFPQRYTLDESEYERIADLAKLQLDDAEEDLREAQDGVSDDEADEADEAPKKDTTQTESDQPPAEIEYVLRAPDLDPALTTAA